MSSLISGNRMFCTNCKGEFFLILPMSITEVCKRMRAFTRLHDGCYKIYPDPENDKISIKQHGKKNERS